MAVLEYTLDNGKKVSVDVSDTTSIKIDGRGIKEICLEDNRALMGEIERGFKTIVKEYHVDERIRDILYTQTIGFTYAALATTSRDEYEAPFSDEEKELYNDAIILAISSIMKDPSLIARLPKKPDPYEDDLK